MLLGDPFAPPEDAVRFARDGTVASLTRAAYRDLLPRGTLAPDRLAVLADALEDAGADGELVGHLREPGPHVRGCWVLDLLLGRQ